MVIPELEIGGAVRRVEPWVDWRAFFAAKRHAESAEESSRLERLRRLRRAPRWWREMDVLRQGGLVFMLRANGLTFGKIAARLRESSVRVAALHRDAVATMNAEADRRFGC